MSETVNRPGEISRPNLTADGTVCGSRVLSPDLFEDFIPGEPLDEKINTYRNLHKTEVGKGLNLELVIFILAKISRRLGQNRRHCTKGKIQMDG